MSSRPPPGRLVIVGASSGVGRAIATELARRGSDLVLVARGERDLAALASDLRLRWGRTATVVRADIASESVDQSELVTRCEEALGEVDAVIITVGAVMEADHGLLSPRQHNDLLAVNFTGPAVLASAFLRAFEARGRGTIVLFSSIAAAAPRRRNMVYSAAKAALESYARSLRHRCAGTEVAIQVYVLGYVETPMSFGLRLRFPAAEPAAIAESVVDSLGRGSLYRYLPPWWRLVTTFLRSLPWPIYSRLDF